MFARNGFRSLLTMTLIGVAVFQLCFQIWPMKALSADDLNDSTVYGTFAPLAMGNPGEVVHRDFYLSIGSKNGLKVGSKVEVLRKVPTHDLLTRKLQKDMVFSIAVLKVIHVEQTASVARVEKLLGDDNSPAVSPRAVMVGDFVRPTR